MKKGIVALFVFVLVSMAFCAWSPGVRAQPDDVWVEESPFTHNIWEFVPGETMAIHIEGTEDDVFDIVIIYDPGGADLQMTDWEDEKVPSSGEIVLTYEIPDSAASLLGYQIQTWDETRTWRWWVDYSFDVVLFDARIEAERDDYIAGEEVTVHYMCWYEKDLGPVDDGYIEWQVKEDGLPAEIADGSIRISDADDAVGTFSFDLGTGAATGDYTIEFWLNDTDSGTADHVIGRTAAFDVETLIVAITLNGQPPSPNIVYAPGESVRVDVAVSVGPWEPVEGAKVDIEVKEDGDVVAAYGADDLLTKSDGTVTHFFTLASDIDDGTEFEVEAEVSIEVLTERETIEFTVEEEAAGALDVNLKFDRNIYMSGETITATAEVQTRGTTADVNYRFWIREAVLWGDQSGDLIDWTIQDSNELQWTVPDDFSGWLYFRVDAKNSEGFEDRDDDWVDVVFGHLLVDADKKEYEAGDTITVSFELISNVMTNPEFFYSVEVGGISIMSGDAGTEDFTFEIPAIPADMYRFRVIATDEGYVVEGSDTSRLLAGFFMSFEFDKEAYSPGDTMTITYEIKARGDST
ncbi:MAG: hypothetical protein KAW39_05845, partial [Thermoplasmata archaeon]|nr:hypothetical protein [Thermoplasmata archaeon]